MKRAWKWFGLVIVLLAIAAGTATYMADAKKRATVAEALASKPPRERNLAVFDAVTGLLKQHYYDSKFFTTPEWQKLETEFRGKAASVDTPMLYLNVLDNLAHAFPESHVAFKPPPSPKKNENPDLQAKFISNYELAMAGPGFVAPEIRRGANRPQVIDDVVRGSPAERAGVTPGWILMDNTTDVTPEHALYKAEFLKLDPGLSRVNEQTGQVTLKLNIAKDEVAARKQFEEFIAAHRVKLEFELEELPARGDFETRRLPGGITYLRFDLFEPLALVGKALSAIDGAGPGGLILDLRRNPGGRQLHLMRVAGALFGGGVELGTSRTAQSTTPMNSFRMTDHYTGPLVVLIGPTSSSAAEIAAAAVQDHKRGKLIGRATNGSVIPGRWFDLPDGGKMMVPMSDFVRSDGRRIEGVGVTPDIWVLPTLEDVRAGRDPVLERAQLEISAMAGVGSAPTVLSN